MEKSCELLLSCCLICLTGNQSHGAQIPVWSVLVPRLCKRKVEERYFRKAEKGDIFPGTVNSSPSQLTPPVTSFTQPVQWCSPAVSGVLVCRDSVLVFVKGIEALEY